MRVRRPASQGVEMTTRVEEGVEGCGGVWREGGGRREEAGLRGVGEKGGQGVWLFGGLLYNWLVLN